MPEQGPPNRPSPTGPYLTASSAYYAGFRGWPLVIMTAIAGRESGWTPGESEIDSNGVYSTGLWQINSDQNVQQLKDPIYAAHTAYGMVGGNSLSGLRAWALDPSPASGQVPTPAYSGYYKDGVWHPLNYTILPYIPQAKAAANEVSTYGPASVDEIRTTSGWQAAGSAGTIPSGGGSGSGIGDTSAGGGCNPNKVFTIPHTSFGPTGCQLKALAGGAAMVGGGLVLVVGLGLMVISGLGGKGPLAAPAQAVVGTAQRVSRIRTGTARSSASRARSRATKATARAEESEAPYRASARTQVEVDKASRSQSRRIDRSVRSRPARSVSYDRRGRRPLPKAGSPESIRRSEQPF